MLLTIIQILVALILALYTTTATFSSTDFIRRVSSPIFVFAVLNASIVLLSLSRNIPSPKSESDNDASSTDLNNPVGAGIEEEFEIRAEDEEEDEEKDKKMMMIVAAVGNDEIETDRSEIVNRSEVLMDSGADLEMVAAEEEEEEEEVVEELSNAEFNRIVEAFLEKQKRFHYQENLSILV